MWAPNHHCVKSYKLGHFIVLFFIAWSEYFELLHKYYIIFYFFFRILDYCDSGSYGVAFHAVVQLNKYETAPYFFSIKPKLDMGFFVDFCVFTFYPFLTEFAWSLKLYCFDVQNNFRFRSGKFRGKRGNTQKSTNNCWDHLNNLFKQWKVRTISGNRMLF